VNRDLIRIGVLDAMHVVAPEADLGGLAGSDDLRSSLDLDSFDLLQILVGLKRRFGVEVPDAVTPELRTLDQWVDWLVPHLPPAVGAQPVAAGRAPARG
jgi:acyl carrier protein